MTALVVVSMSTARSEDTYGGVIAAQAVTQRVLTELATFCAEAAVR